MAEILTIKPTVLRLGGLNVLGNTARMSRQSWLKARRAGLGGSDIGKLLYPGPWGGPLSLYMDKISTDPPEDEGNDYTDYGTIMEETLRATYLPTSLVRMGIPKTAFEIHKSPFIYQSTERPWEMANIDGLITVKEPIEISCIEIKPQVIGAEFKTAGFKTADQWRDNSIPDSYYAQVQWYMGVLGLNYFLVLVLIDRKPEVRLIVRNSAWIDRVSGIARTFWVENVESRLPPESTGSDADLSALALLYPTAKTDDLVDGEDISTAMAAYLGIKAKIDDLTEQKKILEAEIKQKIGDAKGAYTERFEAKWSRWETERFDTVAFKKDHPEMVTQYLKTVPGGRLDVKDKGAKN